MPLFYVNKFIKFKFPLHAYSSLLERQWSTQADRIIDGKVHSIEFLMERTISSSDESSSSIDKSVNKGIDKIIYFGFHVEKCFCFLCVLSLSKEDLKLEKSNKKAKKVEGQKFHAVQKPTKNVVVDYLRD